MPCFMVTNRVLQANGFGSERNPAGNTWWITDSQPLNQLASWHTFSADTLLQEIRAQGKPVLVFIHGFNNSWAKDMETFQEICANLGDDSTVIAYSWDSLGSVFDYLQDRCRAEQSGADLLLLLQALYLPNANLPNVIAHSMGNFLLQMALEKSEKPCIHNLVMVAADVDCDVLKSSKIAQWTGNGLVLYSQLDGALMASTEIHGLIPRLGLTGAARGYPPNFSGVNCTMLMPFHFDFVDNHSFYFQWKEGYQLMRKELEV